MGLEPTADREIYRSRDERDDRYGEENMGYQHCVVNPSPKTGAGKRCLGTRLVVVGEVTRQEYRGKTTGRYHADHVAFALAGPDENVPRCQARCRRGVEARIDFRKGQFHALSRLLDQQDPVYDKSREEDGQIGD